MSRFDPAALAFHAIAVAVLLVLCVALFLMVRSDPAPVPAPAKGGLPAAVDGVKKAIEAVVRPAERAEPAKPSAARKAPTKATMVTIPGQVPLPAGRVWRYNVTLEPPQWRDAVLVYRTAAMQSGTAVYTEFRHAGGKMNFQLGMFAANHASHANVRFPGFFMHPAYLDKALEVGQRFAWEWPWQLPGGAVRAGRLKRYAGQVKGWEQITTPAGAFIAARIDTALSYVEDGRVMAGATETIWYAPQAAQIVRVVREGATPDEAAKRIVAELAALE